MRLAVLAIVLGSFSLARAEPVTDPLLRESRTVTIGGVAETWRLVWAKAPAGICVAEDVEAGTCPCSGFAYGEAGDLWLERVRPGARVERLRLAPFFKEYLDVDAPGMAVVRRQPWLETDGDPAERSPAVTAAITARPTAGLMSLSDYDHDGQATEFLLQVGTMPCGKHMTVAVGVSKTNPHLHALSSVDHPGQPLVLQAWVWQALAKSPRPEPMVIWHCGDHGSAVKSVLAISADGGAIRAVDRDYGCPGERNAGRLVRTQVW